MGASVPLPNSDWSSAIPVPTTVPNSVPQLAVTLLRHLGVGRQWVASLIQLLIYAALLLPGFLKIMWYYYLSGRVQRGILYGTKPRNNLDIYVPFAPEHKATPRPVVLFITGGAWIIGYKAWGSFLAKRLSEHGVVVCCIDYRNFPQGTILDMLRDANTATQWVLRNISKYSGDPGQVLLIGQSAGAHLALLAVLSQVLKDQAPTAISILQPSWELSDIQGIIGISGGYDIESLSWHLDTRGLYRSVFGRIMSVNGDPAFRAVSPAHLVADFFSDNSRSRVTPQMRLIHGTDDRSIPHSTALSFFRLLKAKGFAVDLKLHEDKSHTQLFIEDALRGGQDQVLKEVLELVPGKPVFTPAPALMPGFLIDLATRVCPF